MNRTFVVLRHTNQSNGAKRSAKHIRPLNCAVVGTNFIEVTVVTDLGELFEHVLQIVMNLTCEKKIRRVNKLIGRGGDAPIRFGGVAFLIQAGYI